jgi:hypothetical protein
VSAPASTDVVPIDATSRATASPRTTQTATPTRPTVTRTPTAGPGGTPSPTLTPTGSGGATAVPSTIPGAGAPQVGFTPIPDAVGDGTTGRQPSVPPRVGSKGGPLG